MNSCCLPSPEACHLICNTIKKIVNKDPACPPTVCSFLLEVACNSVLLPGKRPTKFDVCERVVILAMQGWLEHVGWVDSNSMEQLGAHG